jgi:hypothetical protein
MSANQSWSKGAARRALCEALCAPLFTFLVGAGVATSASAQPAPSPASATGVRVAAGFDLGALEEAFWVCDYLGTVRGTEGVDVSRCIAISDALREVRFGDDLDRLVAWWREHKPAQHARLAAREAAVR